MSKRRVNLGRRGEDLAAEALLQRGYEIVERNWRCRVGEVDIVARRDGAWSFVEVRARRGQACGPPEESLTPAKYQRMVEVALTYLGRRELNDVDWRIGFVAVALDQWGQVRRLEVYESIE